MTPDYEDTPCAARVKVKEKFPSAHCVVISHYPQASSGDPRERSRQRKQLKTFHIEVDGFDEYVATARTYRAAWAKAWINLKGR